MATRDAASNICYTLGRGVTRSKRRAMQWRRTSAENGLAAACFTRASRMYGDGPYAREVGHVGDAARVATSDVVTEGHDVPLDVLTSVVHWLLKGGYNPVDKLDGFRREALEGYAYCHNDGCQVVGLPKEFKVCPQYKTARRRVSEIGLECGWAQGDMPHSCIQVKCPLPHD
jgi:hypothetical protein